MSDIMRHNVDFFRTIYVGVSSRIVYSPGLD